MSKKKIILIILTLVTVILTITNPSKSVHDKVVIKSAERIFGKTMVDSIQNSQMGSNLLNGIKGFIGKKGLENIKNAYGEENMELAEKFILNLKPTISQLVERRNYYVCSLTQVEIAGISQTIGIGVLGNVYLFL